MKKVRWIHCDKLRRLTAISDIEKVFKIKLPSDFIECVKKYNGGFPEPDAIYINNEENSLNNLLSLNVEDEENVLETYEALKERLPEKVYPFGVDAFGNYYCFDYSKGPSPTIVFWDHEEPPRRKKQKR